MKNIFKIFTACAVAGSLVLTSCDDWLTLEPENSVTANNYWQSEADVSGAMTGIYISLMNTAPRMFMHGEMRGDNLAPGPSDNTAYLDIREGNITSSNAWVQWAQYYNVINNCNLLLERADKALANDASFTVNACESYKAQATVVRALMYFYLIRTYKDVPYVTWAYYDDQTERNCEVTPQMDILNDLIAQLETVQSSGYLPYSYSTIKPEQNKGQVTMYALKALLADMYRLKGSLETDATASQAAYQKCVDVCNEIIESGQFALIPIAKVAAVDAGGSYLDDAVSSADSAFYICQTSAANTFFQEVFVDGNSAESIFELQADDYNASGSFYSMLVQGSRNYMPYRLRLEQSLFTETVNEVAASVADYSDLRLAINCRGLGDNVYCWKYAGRSVDNLTSYSTNTEYVRNVVVYRLAEIYLMKAEALTQLAWANGEDQERLTEAYMSVFKVRDRACAVEATDVTLGNGDYVQVHFFNQLRQGEDITLSGNLTLSCSSMEQFVLDEECREMLFEGRRWFDVLRHAERNQSGKGSCTGGGINYLLNIVADATTVDKAAFLRNVYQKPESHYLPYPYNDVKMNELLDQKPFYGTE